MKRIEFFKSLMALIGIGTVSQSCESEDTTIETIEEEVAVEETPEEESEYDILKAKLDGASSLLEDKKLYIDLSFSEYDTLKTVGNFYNDTDNYVMILRKDEEKIMAFDNCCPHLGSVTKWSFANDKFTCSNHNNSFGISGGMVAPCSSGMTSGNLKQYSVTQVEDIIVVDFNS